MLSVLLNQHVRIRREHRAQNQRHTTRESLPARNRELIREHDSHAAYTQNNAADLRPAQTFAGQIKVGENEAECGESRLQKSGKTGGDVLLAPEHQTVVQSKRKYSAN